MERQRFKHFIKRKKLIGIESIYKSGGVGNFDLTSFSATSASSIFFSPMEEFGIKYWLVNHPIISNFEWKNGITFGATPQFLILTVLTYLTLTYFLHHHHSPFPPLPTTFLRLITILHNLTILFLSLLMAIGTSLSSISQSPNLPWIFCFPANQTPPHGPTFFWAYIFYLSKILEFIDTFLIILSGSESSRRRLSFLHVYHHSMVVIMCYVWLQTSQSLFPIALVTNATVHTVMYGYYLLCSIGIRPSWKRVVTDCQIVQFVFSFLVSGVMLYYHFVVERCAGFLGWCFNAVFNASLLYLFVDFHSKNYVKKKKDKEKGRR